MDGIFDTGIFDTGIFDTLESTCPGLETTLSISADMTSSANANATLTDSLSITSSMTTSRICE